MIFSSYAVQLASVTQRQCGLPIQAGRYLEFNGLMMTGGITRRSISILNHPIDIFCLLERVVNVSLDIVILVVVVVVTFQRFTRNRY